MLHLLYCSNCSLRGLKWRCWEAAGEGGFGVTNMQEAQLMERLKELARQRGRVKAAQLLGVNFRTLAASIESGKLSRRMREALLKMGELDEGSGDAGGADVDKGELVKRVETLENEVEGLQQAVNEQADGTRELAQRLKKLEADQHGDKQADSVESLVVGPKLNEPSSPEMRPMNSYVLTLEPQEGEAQALGPAAAVVKEWRMLRSGQGIGRSRVERAKAQERRWGLEIALIEEFGLTLPPDTVPLNATDRETHLAWRRETLQRVRKARVRAKRLRVVRRVLTLGLWWR